MRKILSILKVMLFLSSNLVFADPPINSAVCGTGSDSRACITAPEGLLKDSAKTKSFIDALNWLLLAASVIACTVFLLKCSSRLSDEQYKEALGPGVGAGLAALAMYIASKLIF